MSFERTQKSSPCKKTPTSDYGRNRRRINNNHNNNASNISSASRDEPDKKINLSDFLEFLRVSCHLNDLITGNETTNASNVSSASSARGRLTHNSSTTNNNNNNNNSRGRQLNATAAVKRKTTTTNNNNGTTTNNNSNIAASTTNNNNTTATTTTSIVNDEIDLVKLAQSRVVDAFLGTASSKAAVSAQDSKEATPRTANDASHAGHDTDKDNHNNNNNKHMTTPNATTTTTTTANADLKCEIAAAATNANGLNPELKTKLDYVINEGILDALLPFICPVAIPLSFLNRPKPKAGQKTTAPDNAAAAAAAPPPPPPPTTAPANATAPNGVVGGGGGGVGGGGGDLATTEPTKTAPTAELAKLTATKSKESIIKQASVRRKSLFGPKLCESVTLLTVRREPEVIIHVCDEVKNVSRDFTCPQALLISKMGYFADVTAGQKLDDMDISVHCDIQIFEWLMKWVKHTAAQEQQNVSNALEAGPQLDAGNVVPILVSASFLQMEPLLVDCLAFCHARLNDVVRTSTNLACLNDAIVTRLASMFTNVELEMVRDKKERVTPRLWTKLIQSLCETEPEALRGHYYSLSGLFRCVKCGQCLTNTLKEYVSCVPSNVRLNRWGQLVSHHVRDPQWDINQYIAQLFRELKSWRRVYWKLWGHCHFLYCCLCETHFPVYQMGWCRYHPDSPNFLGPVSEGCVPGPTGRHPCCGQQAYRYDTLPSPNGCQFREHSVLVETDRERAIHSISQMVAESNALCDDPPQCLIDAVAPAGANQRPAPECRWDGLSLMPQRFRQGLLPALTPDDLKERLGRSYGDHETTSTDSDDTVDTGDELRPRPRQLPSGEYTSSSSSDGCESECETRPKLMGAAAASSVSRKAPPKKPKRRPVEYLGRFWSGELSARSNQDYQRDFEEKIMKQVCNLVNKKTAAEHGGHVTAPGQPAGGSFVRLEAEWRELIKQRHSTATVHVTGNSHTGLTSRQHRKV